MKVKQLIELLQIHDPDATVGIGVSHYEEDPVRVLNINPAALGFYVEGYIQSGDEEFPDLPEMEYVIIRASLDGRFVDYDDPEIQEDVVRNAIPPDYRPGGH